MNSLLYGVIGTFLLIYVSFLLLKALGKTCLGCLATIFWIFVIIWIFNNFFQRDNVRTLNEMVENN